MQTTVTEEQLLSQVEELMKRSTEAEMRLREKVDEMEDLKKKSGTYEVDVKNYDQIVKGLQFEITQLNKQRIENEQSIHNLKEEICKLNVGIRKGMLENETLR